MTGRMTSWFILSLLLLGACRAATPTQEAPTVELTEFSIMALGTFDAGPNEITVHNEGEFGHTLVIADNEGTVLDVTGVIAPGESSVYSIDLKPGIYELSCRIVIQTGEGRLVDHYQEGMLTAVEVDTSS